MKKALKPQGQALLTHALSFDSVLICLYNLGFGDPPDVCRVFSPLSSSDSDLRRWSAGSDGFFAGSSAMMNYDVYTTAAKERDNTVNIRSILSKIMILHVLAKAILGKGVSIR